MRNKIDLPADHKSSIFQKMIPHLKDGQHVVIVPGDYGGFLLKEMMSDAGAFKLRYDRKKSGNIPALYRWRDAFDSGADAENA